MYLLHNTKLNGDNHFLHQQFYFTDSEHTSVSYFWIQEFRVCNKKYFSYFSTKTYAVGTQKNSLIETDL